MQFKTKVTLIIALLICISLSAFGVVSYIDTKKNSIKQVEANLMMASSSLTDYIDLWLSGQKNILSSSARMLSNMEEMSEAQIKAILQETTKTTGGKDSFLGFEESGVMIYGTNTMQKVDPRKRPWYTLAVSAQKASVTDIYIGTAEPINLIAVTAPIVKNGKIIGAVATMFDLTRVVKAVSDVKINGGYGMLLDTKKTVIAHPKADRLGKESNLKPYFTGQPEGLIEYTQDGINKLFAFKVSVETNWTPGIAFDKETAYAFLNSQVKELFVMGLIMLILSIAIMAFLIKLLLQPLDRLNNVVKDLSSSEGDLRQRLQAASRDEFGQVSGNINKFIEKLHDIVKKSKEISNENASISEELSRTASEVVKNVDAEAKIVSKTKESGIALTNAIEASVQKATTSQETLRKTQQDINTVKNQAEHLEKTMQETAVKEQSLADRLNTVSHNANEVKEVLSIIRDIADQTNLLALNAAIEAARAGEHGRGFAVVADEVRKLAERTQKSLVEIDATINVVVQSIMDANTDIAHNATEVNALAAISMELQNGMNTIDTTVQKTIEDAHATVDNFIHTATQIKGMVEEIEKINVISKENVTSIDNVSQASEHLHTMTENLNNELGKFKS
ncbi:MULTISPECIES: methyl-accepting chemotaxis protein [unclassified Sulfurospirillum]|uniref:methyl-accepting chemotaxis protein n=1 Tax=unclassified Sulfurospirillum TaxID=2618290 RepID=UPI0005081F96|nr:MULTISPECIES: methyl-accepting chemotaxis protein [unclassified Sulfurospirillum]KFL33505.1 chemotaxis protein [Sulfurospirillum sp. SCADC]